ETVLHSFAGGTTDGCFPYAGLLRDKAGNLYGTTQACGASGYGIVFKVNKSGKLTVLHNFAGGATDGANPLYGRLLMDALGNLYGVAQYGGTANMGTVWKLSKRGKEKVLHNFVGGTNDGAIPIAGVILDAKGTLYGDTENG